MAEILSVLLSVFSILEPLNAQGWKLAVDNPNYPVFIFRKNAYIGNTTFRNPMGKTTTESKLCRLTFDRC
jgi:hypothetical protein